MGKKGGGSAPAAPDPMATAQAQGQMNKETAIAQARLNAVNQVTPYGTLTYTSTAGDPYNMSAYNQALQSWQQAMANYGNSYGTNSGKGGQQLTMPEMPSLESFKNPIDVPQYTATTVLSPEQQKMLDQQNALGIKMNDIAGVQLGNLENTLGQPLNFDNIAQVGDYATDRSRVEQALFDRINPQLDRDRGALESRLASQGIGIGSKAYEEAMRNMDNASLAARNQAIASAGQEQSRLVNQGMGLRQQGIQEALALRNQPINEIGAMMGTGQVSMPSFANTPQTGIAAPDYQGAVQNAYNAQLAQYNANQANRQSAMGGLFGLGGSILSSGLMPGGFLV